MAMHSGSSNRHEGSLMSDINVTPLVDVMLVLLTVFIVTAPLLMNAVPVKLPKASASPSVAQIKTTHISVTELGAIYFNNISVSPDQLESHLREANTDKNSSVEISADEKVAYGIVAK